MTQTTGSGTSRRQPRLGRHYWRMWWANSVYRMLGWGLMPLGALAGGFVAHAAGLRAPCVVAGLLCGLALLAAVPLLLAVGHGPETGRVAAGASTAADGPVRRSRLVGEDAGPADDLPALPGAGQRGDH
jgi:hypothetical protein